MRLSSRQRRPTVFGSGRAMLARLRKTYATFIEDSWDAVLRTSRKRAGQAPHSVSPAGRWPVRRGTLFDHGFRRCVLAALSRTAADRSACGSPVAAREGAARGERSASQPALLERALAGPGRR